jgi:hypothetical protein
MDFLYSCFEIVGDCELQKIVPKPAANGEGKRQNSPLL